MKSIKLKFLTQQIQLANEVESKSFSLLHLTGYIILVFSLIDYTDILWDPHLTNLAWELQTITQLVEHIWSPLLGFTFVFMHQQKRIRRFELLVLRNFSWLALILGLLYLLMLPLAINDSITIYNYSRVQISNEAVQRTEQVSKLSQQLNQVNSLSQLQALDRLLNPQGGTQDNLSPQELKQKLSRQLETVSRYVATTTDTAKREQANKLIKAALKVNLGSVLSGVSLLAVWQLTRWTRVSNKNG